MLADFQPIPLEDARKRTKNAMKSRKACVINLRITWVSKYKCPITKSSNRTPVIGYPRDHVPIT